MGLVFQDDPRDETELRSQKYYSVDDAAGWLSVSPETVREMIETGELDAELKGGSRWITRSSLAGAMREKYGPREGG